MDAKRTIFFISLYLSLIIACSLYAPENLIDSGNVIDIEEKNEVNMGEKDMVFWNEPLYSDQPKCTTDFRFTDQLVDPDDVAQIMFGVGSHISPHDHMVYWGVWPLGHTGRQQEQIEPPPGEKIQIAERVQLFAPVDFFYVDVGKGTRSTSEGETYVE